MTIPTLIQDFKQKTTVISLKKAFSTLSQAYTLSVLDNGTPDNWTTNAAGTGAASADYINKLVPYLKVVKNCGTDSGCLAPNVIYKFLTGIDNYKFDTASIYAKVQLSDGMSIVASVSDISCSSERGDSQNLKSTCGTIWVDVNGFKGPNQWGKDLFNFYITKYGITPTGTSDASTGNRFADYCQNTTKEGWSCTAWVLYNENLDYAKNCALTTTLSWGGPTTCN